MFSVDLGRQHDYTAIIVAEEAVWVGEPPMLESWVTRGPQVEAAALWPGTGYTWVAPSSLNAPQRDFFRSRSYNGVRPGRPPLLVRHIDRVRGRSCVDVVAEVRGLPARPPLAELAVALLVDAGGVGVAVLDFMRQQGLQHHASRQLAGIGSRPG